MSLFDAVAVLVVTVWDLVLRGGAQVWGAVPLPLVLLSVLAVGLAVLLEYVKVVGGSR